MKKLSKLFKPHDALLKVALTDLTIAQDFLAQHLSPAMQEKLDISTLKLCPGHLTSKDLRFSETDILFTTEFKEKTTATRPAYLLCHIEHQSTVAQDMALRMIEYKLAILAQDRKVNPSADLPVVLSIVVYNGKTSYTAPTNFYALFGEQQTLAQEVMFNGYQLIDLSQIPDAELAKHSKAGLVEWVLKHVHDRNFMALEAVLVSFLRSYFANLTSVTRQDEDHLLSISYYLLSEANIEIAEQAAFFTIMCDNLPKAVGEKVMSLAQHIEQRGIEKGVLQGMQQGMQQGLEKGVNKGKLEGQYELLTELLVSKFGELNDHYLNLIKQGNSTQLIAWTKKAISAKKLTAIFSID